MNPESKLEILEKIVEDGLSFLDEIKVKVVRENQDEYKQHFLNKGYSVKSGAECLEPPFIRFNYYLLVGRKK